MSNKEIYQKTLGFSVRRFFYDLLAFVVLAGACALGFFIAEKSFDLGLVGLLIGLVVGIVVIAVFLRYVSYTYKAGQIAMMTEGITTGSLPDDVIGGGKAAVKSRFATVAIYFAATGIIKGIFNQIGRGITAIGSSVGGDTGETVGSVISAVVQTIVAYLCDCCLGWVFFRKGVNAGKATCEGARWRVYRHFLRDRRLLHGAVRASFSGARTDLERNRGRPPGRAAGSRNAQNRCRASDRRDSLEHPAQRVRAPVRPDRRAAQLSGVRHKGHADGRVVRASRQQIREVQEAA